MPRPRLLRYRKNALNQERDDPLTHAPLIEDDLRCLEYAMQQSGGQLPTNVADITATIQQRLQAELESHFLDALKQEQQQHKQHIAAI